MTTDHSRQFSQYRSSSLMHISDLYPTMLSAVSSATFDDDSTKSRVVDSVIVKEVNEGTRVNDGTESGVDQWKFLTSGLTDCNQVASDGEAIFHQPPPSPPPRSAIIHRRFVGDYRGGGDTNHTMVVKNMVRLSGVVSSGNFKLIFEPKKKLVESSVEAVEENDMKEVCYLTNMSKRTICVFISCRLSKNNSIILFL
jgi:hypothetical protein